MIAVQDDGSKYVGPAINIIRRVRGKRYSPVYRGSFALIGYYGPGRRPRWVVQSTKRRYRGPTQIFARVPLLKLLPGSSTVI